MYRRFGKRLLDIVFSVLLLALLSPVYLVLAVLVRLRLGSPVICSQERPGLGGKIFRLYKFRTMTDARDGEGRLLPDRERLVPFGMTLRRTSLDELPELLNILRGEMSFVGPRPLLPEYLPWYTEREKTRHSVRPGLTGLAQASGRNGLDWDRRLALDAEYVEKLSFAEDCRVLAMTVRQVVARSSDVAADTSAAEGNLAQIRRERLERTGTLEKTEE